MANVNMRLQKIDDLENETIKLVESLKKLLRYDNIHETKINVTHHDNTKIGISVDTNALVLMCQNELRMKRKEQEQLASNLLKEIIKSGESDERFL